MSRSDHGNLVHTPSVSSSPLTSKVPSVNQDLVPLPTCTTTLNILFIGEIDIGQSSIINLVAGPGEHNRISSPTGRRDDTRSVALNGKNMILHAIPANQSTSTAAFKQGARDTLMELRKTGGVHLLVYCMNVTHSIKWTHEVHRAITSTLAPSPCIPAVAVVTGISDVAQQERWWSSKEAAFVKQGPQFEHHVFIRMKGARSPTGDDVSQSRRILHELILQSHAHALSPAADLDLQLGKPPSPASMSSKDIAIVLLGETGVGKSSLINLIAREKVAEVSPDTEGCTKTCKKYSFEDKGRSFHLYDTPGLVDPLMGIERFIVPIDTIRKLIRSINNGNGPDLLLFCIDKPTVALKRNYHLFCKVLCGGEVPFALAVTRLEEGHDADEWWSLYGDTIRQYGIDRSRCITLGREKGHSGPHADREGRLRDSLLSFFVARTDRPRSKIAPLRSLVGSVTAFLRSKFSTPEKILMNECELEESTARELLNRISASPRSSYDVGAHA